jgi:hypothetical protein
MKITLPGILIFLFLVVGFFLWFGGPQRLPQDSILSQSRVTKAWLYCSLLFVAGAGTACFGDKEYGMFPPTSLRWLFIVIGTFIMVATSAWMHSLRTVVHDNAASVSLNSATSIRYHLSRRPTNRWPQPELDYVS